MIASLSLSHPEPTLVGTFVALAVCAIVWGSYLVALRIARSHARSDAREAIARKTAETDSPEPRPISGHRFKRGLRDDGSVYWMCALEHVAIVLDGACWNVLWTSYVTGTMLGGETKVAINLESERRAAAYLHELADQLKLLEVDE